MNPTALLTATAKTATIGTGTTSSRRDQQKLGFRFHPKNLLGGPMAARVARFCPHHREFVANSRALVSQRGFLHPALRLTSQINGGGDPGPSPRKPPAAYRRDSGKV
jgi:hypothetical protein